MVCSLKYQGGGAAYYLGGGFGEDTAAAILEKLGYAEPYAKSVRCPKAVELAVREKDGERYCFLLNYTKEAQPVQVGKGIHDAATGEAVTGDFALEPYGVRVLRM